MFMGLTDHTASLLSGDRCFSSRWRSLANTDILKLLIAEPNKGLMVCLCTGSSDQRLDRQMKLIYYIQIIIISYYNIK